MQKITLSEILSKSEERANLSADATYKQVTVRLHGKGVVERGEVSGFEIVNKTYFLVREGQFILSRIDARNGAFGLVPAALDGAIVTRDFPSFEIEQSVLLPSYMLWLSRTPAFVELCRQASEGTTNRVRLQESRFLQQTIMLPSLAEQRRIVGRIEVLAEKVEEARRLRETAVKETEALWNSTLSQVFEPVDAHQRTIDEVCEAIIDNLHSTPKYDGDDYPCLRSQDIGYGTINYSTALCTSGSEFIHRTRRGEPRKGDIVYVREGSIGKCGIVDGSYRFCLGQRVMMFRPNQGIINSKYMLYQLMSSPVHDRQILDSKTGTTSHHVNIKQLKTVVLKAPSLTEQNQVVTYLDNLRLRLDKVQGFQESTQKELEALLPSVLDKAFQGEL
jgi:type I restriction enzyme, S subunit